MKHVVVQAPNTPLISNVINGSDSKPPRKVKCHRPDDRDDAAIWAEFESISQTSRYQDVLAARKRLPAFACQNDFLTKLANNRVVIVVGETGW